MTEGTGRPQVLEGVGKLLSIGASVVLAVSVFYDYNFLRALGLGFSEVPTTLADHVRSAIIWGPVLLIAVLVAVWLQLFLIKLHFDRREHFVRAEPDTAVSRLPLRILSVGAVMIAGVFVLFGDWIEGLYWSALFGWLAFGWWFVIYSELGRKGFSLLGAVLFLGIPVLFLAVGSVGHTRGHALLLKTTAAWEVTISAAERREVKLLKGLRRFESAVVLVDSRNQVSVVPSASIVLARQLVSPSLGEALGCEWFGLFCP